MGAEVGREKGGVQCDIGYGDMKRLQADSS